MNKQNINYSQCWEDPVLLNEALAITSKDIVLSITSGGDNTLALLLAHPQKIISIDLNPAQTYLLELKLAAIRALDYEQLLAFLGVKESSHRDILFEKVRNFLSGEAASWWTDHKSFILKGIIHIGRFEKFLHLFHQYILPFIHSQETINAFLNTPTLVAQQEFYRQRWDSKRWHLLFSIISSRFVLKQFARQRGMFTYAKQDAIAHEYQKRLNRNFTAIPLVENYFIHYCLTGHYGKSLPPYLEENGQSVIKNNSSRLFLVTSDLADYLKSMPDHSLSKFNLSDIFEPLSLEENESLWREIVRTAKNNARVVYWNNLVPRSYPKSLSANIKDEKELAYKLYLRDRVFFYGNFHINTIHK